MDTFVDDLRPFLDPELLIWRLGAAITALFVLGWLAGLLHRRRQSQAISHALGNSSRGHIVSKSGPNGRGLSAEIQPAPEPFRQLRFRFVARSFLNPMDLLGLFSGGHESSLTVQGPLCKTPDAELVWIRRQIPDKALGKDPGSALWTYHRLDFINAEYVTRGVNTAALEHAHSELQKRFGPMLQQVSVQRDSDPMVDIRVRTADIPMEEIPALVASVRALGRAALLSHVAGR